MSFALAADQDLPLERADTSPEPTSNVPFHPDFVERGVLLARINAQVSQPAARVAVVGLGGIGKSQLAIEYCYRLREQSRETWVLWIHASSAARFEQGVREIAGLVKIRGRDDPKANIFGLVRDWLRGGKSGKWILVLDNVDDASFLLGPGYDNQGAQEGSKGSNTLFGYLPVCDHGSILITTWSEDAAQKLVERSDMIIINVTPDDTNWGADVVFWGGNEYYQLGTGKRDNVSSPIYIQPLEMEAEVRRAKKASGGKEEHRFHITPRAVAKLGDGRRVSVEQRVECGRGVTAVYSGT
ncbi:hypothetical protein LTR85_000741 [Meristemomyces frigidus]|nr:hypothetical protein LTR85_000741 [Meristemomyces frigidus]